MDSKNRNSKRKSPLEQGQSFSNPKEDCVENDKNRPLGTVIDSETGLRRCLRLKNKHHSESYQNASPSPVPIKKQPKKNHKPNKFHSSEKVLKPQDSKDTHQEFAKLTISQPTIESYNIIKTNKTKDYEEIDYLYQTSSSSNFLKETHNQIGNNIIDSDSNYKEYQNMIIENLKKQISQLEENLEDSKKDCLTLRIQYANNKSEMEKPNEQHCKSICEMTLKINELSNKNTELEVCIQKIVNENQDKEKIILCNANELNEKNKEIEVLKYNLDRQKTIVSSIQKNNSTISEEYRKALDQYEALKNKHNCDYENWKKNNEHLAIVNKNMKDELDNKYCIEIENLMEINNAFEEEIQNMAEVIKEKTLEIDRIKNSDNSYHKVHELENIINQLNFEKSELTNSLRQLSEHLLI